MFHILFLHTPQTINMIQLLQTFSLLSPKWVYQAVLVVRKLPANVGDLRDTSSIPGSGRSPGGGHGNSLQYFWASLVTQLERICLQYRILGFKPWVRKIPWRSEWLPSPVFLPEESPWTEEPGGLQSKGSQRVRYDEATYHLIS